MDANRSAAWNDWVKKEFLYSMRAKGKLDLPMSEAFERKEAAYHHTLPRVFPNRDGQPDMLESATVKLKAAHTAAKQDAAQAKRASRAMIKERLQKVEEQLQQERQKRSVVEGEIQELLHAKQR